MKRSELVKKMLACWDTCKGMGYNNQTAMDRVLELAEENGMIRSVESYEKGYGEMSIGFEPENENS
jgi:hypothetical protein